MIKPWVLPVVAALAVGCLGVAPAHAVGISRVWVSGHGTDGAGCGAPATPCRSLQYAISNVIAAGGEIDVLDPAGYGSATIPFALSIVNDGVGTAGVQATGGSAIRIAAGPTDKVLLRGLSIEGVGAIYGISVTSGGSLTVEDSSVRNFTIGIAYQPSSGGYLEVSNTRVSSNSTSGINVQPVIAAGTGSVSLVVPVDVVVERSEASDDGDGGVLIDGGQSSSATHINVTVADSLLSKSAQAGVIALAPAGTASVFAQVRNCVLSYSQFGVVAEGANASLDIGRSTLNGNNSAFEVGQSAVMGSYGDNNADGNASVGPTPVALTFH